MDATEIRIGNWVNRMYFNPWPDNEGFAFDACRVELINRNTVNLLLSDKSIIGKYKLDSLEPVRLTPEILEKSGFKELGKEYNPSEKWFEIEIPEEEKKVSVSLKESAYCIGDSDYFHEVVFRSKMEVHTLQNLYFSIFGKELEINL